MFKRIVEEVNSREPINQSEESNLLEKFRNGCEISGHELVKAHYRVVLSIAHNYLKGGFQLEELFNEGVLGLYRALEEFDSNKGARFGTYAGCWVKHYIQNFFRDNLRNVRLPSYVVDQITRLSSTEQTLVGELQRTPTDAEIAERAELDEDKLEKLRGYLCGETRFDSPAEGNEGDEGGVHNRHEQWADVHQQCALEYAIKVSDIERIRELILTKLSDIERKVLILRFGLYDQDEHTMKETGEIVKLSTPRIQQIESAILEKLRKWVSRS